MEDKSAEEKFLESERKLSTLMSNLPGMAYRCLNDENWTMEFVSDGCEELTGFKPEELINNARISYAGLIHPEDRYDVWYGVTEGLKNRETYRLTYRITTRTGTEKWVYEQGCGVFGNDEEPVLEGFITDISSQKRAENRLKESLNEKELLLGEIHHRTKNNMQLVISLLELQKEQPVAPTDEALSGIIEKITILADIHEQLYSSDSFSEINIENQIRYIFDRLCSARSDCVGKISIKLDAPEPNFGIDTALPLSLIISELITNSLKHAFCGKNGTIEISIDSSGGKLNRITYTDSGKKSCRLPEGFGINLVRSLASQLSLATEIGGEGPVKFIFYK